jgi:hypothetical protein
MPPPNHENSLFPKNSRRACADAIAPSATGANSAATIRLQEFASLSTERAPFFVSLIVHPSVKTTERLMPSGIKH